MITEVQLGSIQTYGTLSGYIYLHFPKYLCRQFNISPSTAFNIIYKNGKLILEQTKEDKEHAAQLGDSSTKG